MLYPAELRAPDLCSITRLGRTGPAAANGAPALGPDRGGRRKTSPNNASEAGISSTLCAIGRRTQLAKVRRWPVVISEGAWQRAGPVIVIVADRVGQAVTVEV